MTISAYQIDSVISAYSKQNRMKMRSSRLPGDAGTAKPVDIVSLSPKGIEAAEAFKKISYSLIDVIMKEKDGNNPA
jgi:hypothetical protein